MEACRFAAKRLPEAAERLRTLELRGVLAKLPEHAAKPETSIAMQPVETVFVDSEEKLLSILRDRPNPTAFAICADAQLSFSFSPERSYVITAGETLFDAVLQPERIWTALSSLLEDNDVEKLVFDGKSLRHQAAAYGVSVASIGFDAMIADYLLNAIRPAGSLQQLAEQAFHTRETTAAQLFVLKERMYDALRQQELLSLYDDMEMPLSKVLYDMERVGFRVDEQSLLGMQRQFEERAETLSGQIYDMAGERFNILSPKQLGTILFERLGLPPQRKTKSGYSTDAETLDRLQAHHPIVALVQEYRFLTKLKSTFIDGLLHARSGEDGRVRTRFQQCVTATGRISSMEPNLQNIPVRTPLGREIRKAFVASPGNVLVGADYSQIELRLLAHLSEDAGMIASFVSGEDIHRRTASEVFGVPAGEVTGEMRSAAKAVNFGIVYGISDFGLSQNLNIPVKRAGEYIKRYLDRYPGIRAFMEHCVEEGKARGYAVTMFGRRRALPELKSSNYNTRSFGERVAMNMPIQGSAADIIKLAMVHAADRLRSEQLGARLILQVHDELIFDTPEEEQQRVMSLVQDCMEHVCTLRVPLIADVRAGYSWFDTK